MADDGNSKNTRYKALYDQFFGVNPMLLPIIDEMENIGSSSQPRQKKRTEYPRQIRDGVEKLQRDYFDTVPIFPEAQFRRRFCMHMSLFVRMADEVIRQEPYFQQQQDVVGRLGLSPYQKATAAMRLLAYDVSADSLGEYLRISTNSGLDLNKFTRAIVKVFRAHYLRPPNEEDMRQLNFINSGRGFSGILGSIDCMHWKWKNGHTAWAAQYQSGHKKEPLIVLQTVASQNLWIWHAYFGTSGCNNDINVLEESDLFDTLLEVEAPPCNYVINGRGYNMGYYFSDGIYPSWASFVKTIHNPLNPKDRLFAQCQEAVRKYVERVLGVLQARWHILRGSTRLWDQTDLKYIMLACIIWHNMIVEDESPDELMSGNFPVGDSDDLPPELPVIQSRTPGVFRFRDRRVALKNKETHKALQRDLSEHIWQLHGSWGV